MMMVMTMTMTMITLAKKYDKMDVIEPHRHRK